MECICAENLCLNEPTQTPTSTPFYSNNDFTFLTSIQTCYELLFKNLYQINVPEQSCLTLGLCFKPTIVYSKVRVYLQFCEETRKCVNNAYFSNTFTYIAVKQQDFLKYLDHADIFTSYQ